MSIFFDYSNDACLKLSERYADKIQKEVENGCEGAFSLIYHLKNGASNNSEVYGLLKNRVSYPIVCKNYQIANIPHLIPLNMNHEDDVGILKASLRQGLMEIEPNRLFKALPREVYGWVFSPWGSEELAEQIGFIAIQQAVAGEELLRYFDPFVLGCLKNILMPVQLEKLLRPIQLWFRLNGDGQLLTEEASSPRNKHAVSELGLSDYQWNDVEKISIRNSVLIRYRLLNEVVKRKREEECDEVIWSAISRSENSGYTMKKDREEYAYLSLTVHPDFMEHDVVKDKVLKSPYRQLADKLYGLTNEDWERVRVDLSRKGE